MPATLEISGLDKVKARLGDLRDKNEEWSEETLRVVCELIRDSAKDLVPVQTGSLQDSIRLQTYAKTAGKPLTMGVSAGGYVTNPESGELVNYAAVVEVGRAAYAPFEGRFYMKGAMMMHIDKLPHGFRDLMHRSMSK